MKTALIIWGIVIVACIVEACLFAELDEESKEFLKKRENERKNNNLHK
tara:strand:+ start:42 stop:185 length:144 start_codon:yes stop_codon:yes gene_type:complete